ncbi:hypothetical protein OIU84_005927, partial [Salix udensis]
MIWGKY